MKTRRKDIYLIPLFTILFFINYIFRKNLSYDELWNFSYAYNIANGYLPYSDYNMLITPFYPFIMGTLIKIFSNKYLIYLLINSIFASSIVYLSKEKKENYLLVLFMLLVVTPFTYNTFIILLYYLLVKYDDNDIISGLLIGIIFLTKQNIGILLFICMFFYSKNRFKRFIYFLIPNMIFAIYLFGTDTFFDFFNQTVLNLFEFTSNNNAFNKELSILSILFVIVLIVITRLKNRKDLYLLSIELLSFPMFDFYHVFTAWIPLFGLFFKKFNNKIILVFITVILLVCTLSFNNYPNNSKVFKYRNIYNFVNNIDVKRYKDYLSDKLDNNIIIVSSKGTYIKEELDIKPSKYDIPSYGNMGLNGTKDLINYIEEKCFTDCIIIKDYDNWQLNKEVINYIEDNYIEIEKNIYRN